MHLLAAFLIGTTLIAGYFPVKDRAKKTISVAVNDQNIRIRPKVEPQSEFNDKRTIKQEYDYSCGSAALATLLNFYLGEDLDERQVINGMLKYGNKEMIVKRRAFSFLDMKKFVDALGYIGAGYKAEIKDLEELQVPGIVPVKLYGYRHFTVFKGFYDGHVFLSDPWRGNISFTKSDFIKAWYQNVVFIAHPNNKKEFDLLALRASDLRYITEDTIRKEMFDQGDAHKNMTTDRYRRNLSSSDILFKK